MEKVLDQITKDLGTIKEIVDTGRKYPVESIKTIQERILYNSEIVLSKKEVAVGEWVQVFSGGREPFYAKVNHIYKDGYATLEGIYNYDKEDSNKKVSNSFPLDVILPVSEEIGRLLEYCNNNNKRNMV